MAGGKTRILILEDDRILGGLLQVSLEEAGYAVALVTTSDQALERFEAAPYDAVLSDIIIREHGRTAANGGLTAIFRIKSLAQRFERRVFVVAMSGAPGVQDVLTHAKSMGADAILEKPFEPTELLDLLRFHCPPRKP